MTFYEEIYEIFHPLIDSSQPEVSIGVLEKLTELHPDFAIAHNDLGVLYYNSGEKEKALDQYQEAARLQPENIIFQKNLADFYYVEKGLIEEALRIYIKILERHPEDVETLLVTAHICVSLRRFDDAKFFYSRIMEIEPWNSQAQENLKHLEKIDQSGIGFETAEEMYQEIQKMIDVGQPDKAIEGLKELIERWPDFAIAYNDLGVLYYNMGEKDKALILYQKAARLQPENVTFQKNLADFYYVEEGRVEEAMQIYVKILESHPEDIETLLATGHICESLKKIDDAKVFYNRILEIEPWNSEAHQNLEALGTCFEEV